MDAKAKQTWQLTDAYNDNFVSYAKLNEKRDPARENKPFYYPGPYNRSINGTPSIVKRGFMRSIILGGDVAQAMLGGEPPANFRLNFQFNPEYIERKVQQSIGSVNPLLQNPTNLTQAVPGTAQFNFTMTFNREHEVAKGAGFNIDLTNELTLQTAFETALSDPGQVGVMHDLAMFDKIIGQGITSDIVNIISKYTRTQTEEINKAKAATTDTTDATGDKSKTDTGEETEPKGVTFVESDFLNSVNNNFGNSAFLNPLPVRVVFSDLFMVEGLVVSSAVAFQKFSQKMIPTICQVNVELYALYVGFAKRKAFLTDNLTDWANNERTTAGKNAERVKTITADVKKRTTNAFFLFNNVSDSPKVDTINSSLLKAPDYNANGMRVLLPKTTETYYSGNQTTPTNRYVTFQQWFNTFAAGDDVTIEYPAGTNIKQNIINDYRIYQNATSADNIKGYLPVTVYMDYDEQKKPLDANFNVSFTAFVPSKINGDKTYTFEILPDSAAWKLVERPGLLNKEGRPATPANKNKTKFWKRVFWIKPTPLTKSDRFITSAVQLKINISATVKSDELPEQVVVTFNEVMIPFSTTDPLFYAVNYNNVNVKVHQCAIKDFDDPRTGA